MFDENEQQTTTVTEEQVTETNPETQAEEKETDTGNKDEDEETVYEPGKVVGTISDEELGLFQIAQRLYKDIVKLGRLRDELDYKGTVLDAMRILWWFGIRQRIGILSRKVPLQFNEETREITVSQEDDFLKGLRNLIYN